MKIKKHIAATIIVIVSLIFLLTGYIWLIKYRFDQPLDIDEAGYLSIALNNYLAFESGGLIAWVNSVLGPSIQAPIVPACASVLFCVFGITDYVTFLIPLLSGTATIIVTYLLATRLANSSAGIISVLLVASYPSLIEYSRDFHFSASATLIYTGAVYALVRSNRFSNITWSITFGVLLGLLPLARTMTIAFIPGFVLAAICYIIAENKNLFQRFRLLALGLIIGFAVSGVWFIPHAKMVFGYLTSFGYGSRSLEYVIKSAPEDFLKKEVILFTNHVELFVPHLIIVILGLIVCIILITLKVFRYKSDSLKNIIQSNFLPIAIISLVSLLALHSSKNIGSAFYTPVMTTIISGITAFIWIETKNRYLHFTYVILSVVIYLIATAPFLSQDLPISSPILIKTPFFGELRFTDGRGCLLNYLEAGGILKNGKEKLSIAEGNQWTSFDRSLTEVINRNSDNSYLVAFAFRHCLSNVNTISYQQLRSKNPPFWMTMIEPSVTGASTTGYKKWISSLQPNKSIIIASNKPGTFEPLVDPILMKTSLEECGYEMVQVIEAPDGQMISLWKR